MTGFLVLVAIIVLIIGLWFMLRGGNKATSSVGSEEGAQSRADRSLKESGASTLRKEDDPFMQALREGKVDQHASSIGVTPLIVAVEQGSSEAVEYLLEHGADTEGVGQQGHTALFYALYSRNGKREIVEALLDHNANANVIDENGQSPLMLAAQNGFDELAKLLIDRGANPNFEDSRGQTALALAESRDLSRVADVIRAAGGAKSLDDLGAEQADEWLDKALSGDDPEVEGEIQEEIRRLGLD